MAQGHEHFEFGYGVDLQRVIGAGKRLFNNSVQPPDDLDELAVLPDSPSSGSGGSALTLDLDNTPHKADSHEFALERYH